MADPAGSPNVETIMVPIGRWAVAWAPTRIRTLLGSCVAATLYDSLNQAGSLAHIVLPDSRGVSDDPGRYADTAIPSMFDALKAWTGSSKPRHLVAKLVGGANMFPTPMTQSIGEKNREAAEAILKALRIPVVSHDLGGETGRKVTLDTRTGTLAVKIPGGAEYWL